MIQRRLQTIVSRESQPGEFAVLTVGSVQAGSKSNVIDDHAVIQLNNRSGILGLVGAPRGGRGRPWPEYGQLADCPVHGVGFERAFGRHR